MPAWVTNYNHAFFQSSIIVFFLLFQGMTTWLCISPSTVLLLLLTLPPLVLVFHCLMDKRESTRCVSKTTDRGNILYSALDSCEQDDHMSLTWHEILQVVWQDGPLFLSLYLGMFFEFITIQSIVTTLAFPSAPFDPRNHYQYYMLLFFAGEFVGRLYGLLVSFMNCKIPHATRNTWVFTSILIVVAMFLIFASWYRFLHNVYIVLALVFLSGLSIGSLFSSTYAMAGRASSARQIEFSRSFLTIAIGAGGITAGLVGLYVEPLLKEHCQQTIFAIEYCLTRPSGGWNASSCLGHNWSRVAVWWRRFHVEKDWAVYCGRLNNLISVKRSSMARRTIQVPLSFFLSLICGFFLIVCTAADICEMGGC